MPMLSQITGVHTVGVPVTDQDRAIDFYVGTLGFDKRLDADMGGGRRWIEVVPGGSAITIALVAARGRTGRPAAAASMAASTAGLRAAASGASEAMASRSAEGRGSAVWGSAVRGSAVRGSAVRGSAVRDSAW